MDNIDNVAFLLKKLFAAYSHKTSAQGMIAVYLERLQSIPVEELGPVIEQCLDECKFLPTIAEIKERHYRLCAPDLESTAIEEWTKVQKAARLTHLPEVSVTWRNPITVKAIAAMGGLNQIGKTDKPGVERAQFLNIWKALAQAAEGESRLTPSARQLAERKGGLKPIGDVLALPGTGGENGRNN